METTKRVPTFRFDDVSVNTDIPKLLELLDVIELCRPGSEILLAVSPVVFENIGERVHPSVLTAGSSLHPYYGGTKLGSPVGNIRIRTDASRVRFAGHGMAHVDHRLLGRKAQEMSIVMSCAIARSNIFVPPYNKWNAKTVDICGQHQIVLIKHEQGWKHVLHNPFLTREDRYYLHPYDLTPLQLQGWFVAGAIAEGR